MKKILAIVSSVVVLAVLIGGGYFLYARTNGQESLEFTYGDVKKGDIESVVIATGALEPLNTVVVGSEVSGQISEIFVDFNDSVDENQVIARLDARSREAALEQRQADVEVARATIESREAELTRAKANLSRNQRELERLVSLQDKGHVSTSALESQINSVDAALAQLEIAKASVTNSHASLTKALASLSQSELELDRTFIRSPTSGTIINRNIEIGQTVAASFSAPELFVIADDLHQMKVETSVDEADIGRIREGMASRFTVDSYPDREYEGRILQIRKQPVQASNVVTYKVIVTARNEDLSLLPGMTASVEIVLGKREGVLTVPNGALTYRPRSAEDDAGAGAGGGGGFAGGQGGSGGRPSGFSGGGGGGGRSGGGQYMALLETLNLNDEQKKQIEQINQRMRQQMGSLAAGGGGDSDRAAMMRQFQSLMSETTKEISALLNEEQKVKFNEMFAPQQRSSSKPGTVYVRNADGVEERKNIRIGLQDDNLTEVVSGLDEGDSVIVRARRRAA